MAGWMQMGISTLAEGENIDEDGGKCKCVDVKI